MKKQIIFILSFILISITGFGQSQKSFDQLIAQTNQYLVEYEKLSPFEEFYQIKDFGLSKKEIKELIKDSDDNDFNKGKDSIVSMYLILYFQDKIIDNIQKLVYHDKFEVNGTQALWSEGDLATVVSEDKKLYNFSLDEKTGGSYRSRISLTHYTDIERDNFPTEDEINQRTKVNPYEVFESDGFSEIHSIATEEGTKYVMTGYTRGCSYCFQTYIMLVQFKNGVFQQEFYYSVNSRSWEGGVEYNHSTKTITVNYITDDLTTNCYCSNSDEASNDYDETFIEKKCHCTFQFDGLNFELIKESSENSVRK